MSLSNRSLSLAGLTEQKLTVLLHQEEGCETQQGTHRDRANSIVEALAGAMGKPCAHTCKTKALTEVSKTLRMKTKGLHLPLGEMLLVKLRLAPCIR